MVNMVKKKALGKSGIIKMLNDVWNGGNNERATARLSRSDIKRLAKSISQIQSKPEQEQEMFMEWDE